MAFPPICHWERISKISALGHIAIGTWTMIGCNGCFSHFPSSKSSDHFMGRNCASHLDRHHSSRPERKRLQLNVRSAIEACARQISARQQNEKQPNEKELTYPAL